MNSKQRVLKAIAHEEPDRVPLNIWMYRPDVQERVIEKYGTLDNFFERLGIDMFMAITPAPNKYNPEFKEELMTMKLEGVNPDLFADPDDESIYAEIKKLVQKYGKDKAILAHVWGVLEGAYSFLGVEQTLTHLGLRSEKLLTLFQQIRDWSIKIAENAVRMGIDVLHITSDVGANDRCLISPTCWRELICVNDREIIVVGKEKGLPISMHSCGNISQILDKIVEMGVNMIHPLQTSAGMDILKVKKEYGEKLTIHGGLDIRYILPRAPEEELIRTIKHYMKALKPGGGFIFNTEHTVQPDTAIERVELAYKVALEEGQY